MSSWRILAVDFAMTDLRDLSIIIVMIQIDFCIDGYGYNYFGLKWFITVLYNH